MRVKRPPLSPLTLLATAWLTPLAFYGLRLSTDFDRPIREPALLTLLIVGTLAIPFFYLKLDWILRGRPMRLADLSIQSQIQRPKAQIGQAATIARWFKVWWVVAATEMVLEREVPAITYLATGRGDYRNFGIPTVHGAILAAALALTILAYTVGRSSNENRWLLKYAASLPVYAVLIFARKGLIVTILFIVLYELSTSRITISQIRRILPVVVAAFLLFTLVGNSRTSGPPIQERARIQQEFEDFPSGIIWVYMYVTSPLENLTSLVYEFDSTSEESIGLSNTFGGLIPLAGKANEANSTSEVNASRYWLTNSAFNVSTGIEPIYRDGGIFLVVGVMGSYSFIISFLYFRRRDVGAQRTYLLLLAIGVLQIFSNNFGNLNVVAAFPILVWFGRRYGDDVKLSGSPSSSELTRFRVGARI